MVVVKHQGTIYDETFSTRCQTLLPYGYFSLLFLDMAIHQFDRENAFPSRHLKRTDFMHSQQDLLTSSFDMFASAKVALCLKQALVLGFNNGPDTAYLLLYVDDIILTASSTSLLQCIISLLHAEFAMTDLGPLYYFLGISATRTTSIDAEILKQAQMLNCNPCRTPIDTGKKLGPEGSPFTDPTLYRGLAGSLQYLTFTRPDFSYAVQQLCCPATRRSTSGYCVFLGDNLLTWSSKRQDTLSRSSVEAEYRGVANAIAETSWIHNLLRELHTLLFTATLVYCDNVSAVYMSANPVQHQRTKHIEIDIHFVHDKVAAGHVRVLHVLSRFQYADIFTKGLPYPLFTNFRSSLSVRKSPAPTVGAY
ncbi:ribonuclease H-like domain-containing protein [Tanacetum coccineum]